MTIVANAIFLGFYSIALIVPVVVYVRRQQRQEQRVRDAVASGELTRAAPFGQHPRIDVTNCIGCQACTAACPEGGVLGMVGGKAAVVKPHRCIGHGLCADACPVGAITLVRADPSLNADLPYLTPELETSVPNLYIAGELGGLALIKNAVAQGRSCIDAIAARLDANRPRETEVYDVVIVGAGPAGISASLRAIELGLRYVTIERESLGGSVARYPRQKLVMTSPIEFPMHITLRKMQLSKENLLAFWSDICSRDDFRIRLNEPVERIQRREDGRFVVTTPAAEYQARGVVLALGRSGTPRKLGIPGEDLPKVMYRLLEADHYVNKRILVVGGGDSAVEAAIGLALQKGNQVTLSYRKASFNRIKERNLQRLDRSLRSGKLEVAFNSIPLEIREDRVLLEVEGAVREVANDFVWIFAGGVAANEFLKKIGVRFGTRNLTLEAVREASAAVMGAESLCETG